MLRSRLVSGRRTVRRAATGRNAVLRVVAIAAAATALVSLTGITAVTPANAATPASVAVSTVHPRLLATQTDFDRLKTQVGRDSVSAKVYAAVKGDADALLRTTSTLKYAKATGVSLTTVPQTLVRNAYTLGMMYKLTGNRAYADRLWKDLSTTAAFPNWNPDHFLDTAEITNAFAVSYDWLYPYWTPAQRSTLASAIATKGLQPSLVIYNAPATSGGPYKFGGNWSQQTGNWNLVVNGGMAMGAMAISDAYPALSKTILADSLRSVQKGVSGFANGGGWVEGLGYWEYGTRYFTTMVQALKTATGSDQGLLGKPGVRETGYFPLYLTSNTGSSFTFADSPAGPYRSSSMEAFGKLFRDPVLSQAASAPNEFGSDVQRLLSIDPTLAQTTPNAGGIALDRVFANAGVTTFRSSWTDPNATYVGYRSSNVPLAGHQDLDAGTFSLMALGQTFGEELGKDAYDLPGYFEVGKTGERWDYYRKRAEGQNTLVIDPSDPSSGYTETTTPAAKFSANNASAISISDLSSVYKGKVLAWKRGVRTFDDKTQVIVQDDIASSRAFEAVWTMHTQAGIRISADGKTALLYRNGKVMAARITSPGTSTFVDTASTPYPTSPAPAGQTSNASMRSLEIDLHGAPGTTRLTVQFTPVLDPAAALPAPAAVTPLSSWTLEPTGTALATSLRVGGVGVAGFRPDVLHYTVQADPARAAPPVAVTGPAGATVSTTVPRTIPGIATATVTSGGRSTTYDIAVERGPAAVSSVSADTSSAGTPPQRTIDGDTSTVWTTWATEESPSPIFWRLADDDEVSAVMLTWQANLDRHTAFTLETSPDGSTWTTRYSGAYNGPSGDQLLRFPSSPTIRYAKLTVLGTGTVAAKASLAEARFFTYDATPTAAAAVPTHLASVALTAPPAKLNVGNAVALKYAALDNGGGRVWAGTPTYVSSDPAVVRVDAKGVVRAVGVGTARIGVVLTSGRYQAGSGSSVTVADPSKARFSSDSDTYVQGGSAARKNFGTGATLIVKPSAAGKPVSDITRVALVHFDLRKLAGKKVKSAVVSVTGKVSDLGGSAVRVDAHALVGSWGEKTATWSNAPRLGAAVGSSIVKTAPSVGRYDVTKLVNAPGFSGSLSIGFTEDRPARPLLVVLSSRESKTPPVLDLVLAS